MSTRHYTLTELKAICVLSNGCRSPVYQCDACPYRKGDPGCNCEATKQPCIRAVTRKRVERIGAGTGPLKAGEPIKIIQGNSTLFTVHRPPRRRNESPVQYYRRTRCVDDNFTRGWRGWYYCNPAHCKHRWRSKAERDKHLDMAYAILG